MHFSYVAIDKSGRRTSGDLDAESVKAAATMLRSQSLMPVSIGTEKAANKLGIDTKNIFARVSLLDKIMFIKNFSVMLKSGFPISRALSALVEQSDNPAMKSALSDIGGQVEAGQTLSSAMARHPKIFSVLFINVVRVGEISGNLEESLMNLAVQLEKDHALLRKTRGAMIYPAIVLSAMMLVAIVMFTFVLPKLTQLFEEFDVELPFITRVIIGAVNFMKNYGIFVLLAFIGGIVGFVLSLRNQQTRNILDKIILRMPVLGKVVRFTNVARFARTLSSLVKSGMPILESVKVTGEALGNNEYRQAIAMSEDQLRSGTQLSATLRNHPKLFPVMVVNMVKVGEESGNVDGLLGEVAIFYEAEVDQVVSNLSSILEPILMLVVGVGVGVLAVGLVMPIYSITQSI